MKIGVVGLAGAGKDTAVDAIKDFYDVKVERFAAPLKFAAECVFGAEFDQREVKEKLVQVDPDRTLEAVFNMCLGLGFSGAEMDKASELFHEHIGLADVLSPREFQQLAGTEVVRAVRPDAFRDRVLNLRTDKDVLIPDVRFENEVPNVLLLVVRPGIGFKVNPHVSEQFADTLTSEYLYSGAKAFGYKLSDGRTVPVYVLKNDGTKAEFRAKAREFYKYLKGIEK